MESTPLVSAIILNYRNPQYTVHCVENLQKQSIADQMEILVVDNESNDDSIGVLRNRLSKKERVRIVETPRNLGFGGGNNVGARYAKGRYLLIVNPDTEPEPRGVERLICQMEADRGIGIIAPKLQFADRSIRNSVRRFPTVWDFVVKRTLLRHFFPHFLDQYLRKNVEALHPQDVEWVVGACMLIRRKLFEDLHGFDERFFLFLEDTDLCRRCWKSGLRVVYDPATHASDRKERLSGEGFLPILFTKTGRIHIRSACKYFWKWRGDRMRNAG